MPAPGQCQAGKMLEKIQWQTKVVMELPHTQVVATVASHAQESSSTKCQTCRASSPWSNDSAILTLISRCPMAAAAGVLSSSHICGVPSVHLGANQNEEQTRSADVYSIYFPSQPLSISTVTDSTRFFPFPLIDTSLSTVKHFKKKKKPLSSSRSFTSPPMLPKIRLPPSKTTPPSSQPRNSFTETDYYRKTREEIYSPLSRAQLESSHSGSPVSIISFPLICAHACVYPATRPIHGSRR
ncbi:hypothetical protein B0H10DRAFT_866915 [Mycena sp. CBHHK59/15]|nr:hypothetical protein B0H10DRAFT_866915 [Mycena sp. CBHHK59/15]